MASFFQRMILVTLVLTISIPISICHRERLKNKCDCGDDSEPDHINCGDDSEPDIDDDREDSEIGNYLRDICSDTEKPKQCWKIIKAEITRFTDTDSRNVAGIAVDLAIAKSTEIKDQLNQFNQKPAESALKVKYAFCLNSYNDAKHNLETVKGNIYTCGNCGNISTRVDNVTHDLTSCKERFDETGFDPANIRDRNKGFGHYVDIVRAAISRFLRENDGYNARKTQSN
ncbi:hypothetical protein ACS0TY_019223 [Phlomoides rotata]